MGATRAAQNTLTGTEEQVPAAEPGLRGRVALTSDPLPTVEAKLREYVENGARLGWHIAPETRRAHVYQLKNREISARLVISEKTVGNHISNIFTKLQVNDRSQAIVRVLRGGLVDEER